MTNSSEGTFVMPEYSGNQWPKITVVMPSLNQEPFLEEAINSVLSQGYPNLEYMILDGGSSDGSRNLIRKYSDKLAYWRSGPDDGQAAAINEGFSRSTGDILGWLNSDDLYLSGALFAVAMEYKRCPEARLIWGDCAVANQKGTILSTKRAKNWNRRRILLGASLPQPSTFITRPVIEEVGLLDPTFRYALDWTFFSRIFLRYPSELLRYLPKTLAVDRHHDATKSRTGMHLITEERRRFLQHVFEEEGLPPELQNIKRLAVARTYWRQAFLALQGRHYRAVAKSVRAGLQVDPASFLQAVISAIRLAFLSVWTRLASHTRSTSDKK